MLTGFFFVKIKHMYKNSVIYIKLLQKKDKRIKLCFGRMKALGGQLLMMYYIFSLLIIFNLGYFILSSLNHLVF